MKIRLYRAQFFLSVIGKACYVLLLLLIVLSPMEAQVQTFEIISRTPISDLNAAGAGVHTQNKYFSYEYKREQNKIRYKVLTKSSTFTIDALSNLDYSEDADRIVSYGDSI